MANYDSSRSSNGYVFRISITTKSQNPSNNTSLLNWAAYIINPNNHSSNARSTGKVVVDGSTVWNISGSTVHTGSAGQTKLIASGTRTVTHGSNGKASVSVSGNFKTDTQGGGWSIPLLAVSGTYTPHDLGSLPKAPGTCTLTKDLTTRVLRITSPVASSSSPITGYQIASRYRLEYITGADYTPYLIRNANSARNIPLTPNVLATYRFRARAVTATGPGPWGEAISYMNVDPTAQVLHQGVWKSAVAFVKVGRDWVGAVGYVKVGSTWKRTGV